MTQKEKYELHLELVELFRSDEGQKVIEKQIKACANKNDIEKKEKRKKVIK